MKIDLNLIRSELEKQRRTQIELAEHLKVSPRTMVSIFKKGDCTIKQFEKMIEFFGCTGKDMGNFITIASGHAYIVSGLDLNITLRKHIEGILDDERRMRRELRDQDILRKALVDKDKIIKLLEEKIKAE